MGSVALVSESTEFRGDFVFVVDLTDRLWPGKREKRLCWHALKYLCVQDGTDGRDREYIEALRNTYLMYGRSRREARPIKKRVRISFVLACINPRSFFRAGEAFAHTAIFP